jgi:tetratricopeptide (TPR) repeat protein
MSDQRPFPGLRPFDFRDRDFFFGREDQIYALYRLIDRSRFVAVVGGSGSGKSSLVRAGLLPLLDEESNEQGGRTWQRRVMRPGEAPIPRLAAALMSLAFDDDPAIAAVRQERIEFDLRRSSFGISDALGKIEHFVDFSLLLVVDQFEELFRYASGDAVNARDTPEASRSRDEAAQFVQLLLEGSRASSSNIHIVVTMRSDFIGDCARFHGLPEAVSATQFLVPSLTRDQLEEVIRKPLEKTGDTIEPALVERILNDSSDELDQLPVLQHCLLRLWERADVHRDTDIVDEAFYERNEDETAARRMRGRYLTTKDYVDIGRIDGALSKHAEEILSELSGLVLAVEQAFRALAEIDREGRAIRRALPFSQLLDETGIPEYQLRRVIDRFRADDCSFLVPSPVDNPMIVPGTRIDVGHEALLRRWARTCGVKSLAAASSDDESDGTAMRRGWLADEERDGQLYRGLLSLLDHEGGEVPTLPLSLVNERWSWWNARPRTAAWAARYGGDFDRVRQLLDRSLAALTAEEARKLREVEKERSRAKLQARVTWITRIAGAVVIVSLLTVTILGYNSYRQAEENAQQYRRVLERIAEMNNQIKEEVNIGAVSLDLAKEFLETLNIAGNELQKGAHAPEVTELVVKLQHKNYDAWYSLADYKKALQIAQDVTQLANGLVDTDPYNIEWQWLTYESIFRFGDALAAQKNHEGALEKFHEAFGVAQRLTAIDPKKGMSRLIFIEGKIGETLQEQHKISEARAEFENALRIVNELVAMEPKNQESRRSLATTLTKIGKVLLLETPPEVAGAVGQFDAALAVLEELVDEQPHNDIFISNLATAYGSKAKALSEVDRNAAIAGYQSAIATRKPLVDEHPNTVSGLVYLAKDYERLGALLRTGNDTTGAFDAFQNAAKIRKNLADKAPNNTDWQKAFKDDQDALAQLQGSLPELGHDIDPVRSNQSGFVTLPN